MEQTAISWLYNWMENNQYFIGNDLLKAIDEAKEMQKDQIAEAYETGWINGNLKKASIGGEDYYGEDYYEDKYSHPDPSDDEIYNNFNHEGGIKY